MRDCKLLWLQQRVGAEVKQGEWTPARRTSSLATQVTNTAPLRAQGQGEGERCLVCSPTPHPTLRVCVCVRMHDSRIATSSTIRRLLLRASSELCCS